MFIFLARSYICTGNQSPTCSNKVLAAITLKTKNKNQTTNFLILKTCKFTKEFDQVKDNFLKLIYK